MNTLKSTIDRLQELSYQSTDEESETPDSTPASPEIDSLVIEIERMANEPLYRGRPLGDSLTLVEPEGASTHGVNLESQQLEGVEVLEGRFESTNDSLVGVFEQSNDQWSRKAEWNPSVIQGLRSEMAGIQMSIPIVPFSLKRAGRQLCEKATLIRDVSAAGQLASSACKQILSMSRVSMEAQANTLGRTVQSLLI